MPRKKCSADVSTDTSQTADEVTLSAVEQTELAKIKCVETPKAVSW